MASDKDTAKEKSSASAGPDTVAEKLSAMLGKSSESAESDVSGPEGPDAKPAGRRSKAPDGSDPYHG
ncbi:hypothetical protein [Actinomadura harenae]|uniref:Uncharacterized protein n=1 Tax=Actinomadura harenae TaxID=2483351 RepID=A0A3M2LSD1_9ACTN|nr:hypothetical protein [Actinomadura harenae]RMI38995.1 hypothetical protein EBO15_31015 [Actinomadura harenae]